jgi:hypothetical protein
MSRSAGPSPTASCLIRMLSVAPGAFRPSALPPEPDRVAIFRRPHHVRSVDHRPFGGRLTMASLCSGVMRSATRERLRTGGSVR